MPAVAAMYSAPTFLIRSGWAAENSCGVDPSKPFRCADKRPMDLKPGQNVLGTPLLTPADLGEHLRLSEKTLANWRCQGRGPAFLRVSRDIRYRPEDVLAWLEGEQILRDEAPTDRKAG